MAAGLPSGTVTFLFTDVVGSTPLWETAPEEMRPTITGLEDLTRAAIERHDGTLVKSVGDGAMAAFQDAERAVTAAIDLQRRFTSPGLPVPLEVRIGLHTGQATPVGGDYLAPAVNRAARIAGAAHGGQILVSDATATLLEHTPTLDLGEHQLKGLHPQRLHQVIADGLRAEFPAHATALVARVALPSPSTSFIGRADDVSTVMHLIREQPLITLTGAGGCGKTRLAIAIARRLADDFPDGVVFADLAATSDDAGVASTVAQVLNLSADLTDQPVHRISGYLSTRTVLCVLDNCEHLLDAAATVAASVVATGGRSRVLATSREPLGLLGEQVYAVASLDLETEAAQLFADRAREARASFALDASNRPAVIELCRRLDGIPLAIELAAARVTHLAPSQLVDRLDDRFRLLTGGRRRVSRHQTLTATLDWSHDLLEPDEQAMLRRLAVFPASFPLEAVEGLAGIDEPVDALGSLVAKSLIDQVPEPDGTLRYRLLETVRMYAHDRLVTADEAEGQHTAHRDFTIDRLEAQPLEERWLGDRDVLASERPSVRAALQWSADTGDLPALARLVSAVDWTRSADWHDGLRWTDAVCDRVEEVEPELRRRVLLTRTIMSSVSAAPGGATYALRALEVDASDDSPLRAVATSWTALYRTQRAPSEARRQEAVQLAEQGLRMARDTSAPWLLYCSLLTAMTYIGLGATTTTLDDRAEAHLRAADVITGYDRLADAVRQHLGLCALVRDDPAEALRIVGKGDPVHRVVPMLGVAQQTVQIMASGAVGRVDDAKDLVRSTWEAMDRMDLQGGAGIIAVDAAGLAAITEQWEQASWLLGAGSVSVTRSPLASFVYFWTRERTRRALGPDRYRPLRDEGRALSPEQALERFLA